MILIFYAVDNPREFTPSFFEGMEEKKILDLLLDLKDETLDCGVHIYDCTADRNSIYPNLKDFQIDYNNEDLDLGFYSQLLPTIEAKDIVEHNVKQIKKK